MTDRKDKCLYIRVANCVRQQALFIEKESHSEIITMIRELLGFEPDTNFIIKYNLYGTTLTIFSSTKDGLGLDKVMSRLNDQHPLTIETIQKKTEELSGRSNRKKFFSTKRKRKKTYEDFCRDIQHVCSLFTDKKSTLGKFTKRCRVKVEGDNKHSVNLVSSFLQNRRCLAVCFNEPYLVLHPLLVRNPVTGVPIRLTMPTAFFYHLESSLNTLINPTTRSKATTKAELIQSQAELALASLKQYKSNRSMTREDMVAKLPEIEELKVYKPEAVCIYTPKHRMLKRVAASNLHEMTGIIELLNGFDVPKRSTAQEMLLGPQTDSETDLEGECSDEEGDEKQGGTSSLTNGVCIELEQPVGGWLTTLEGLKLNIELIGASPPPVSVLGIMNTDPKRICFASALFQALITIPQLVHLIVQEAAAESLLGKVGAVCAKLSQGLAVTSDEVDSILKEVNMDTCWEDSIELLQLLFQANIEKHTESVNVVQDVTTESHTNCFNKQHTTYLSNYLALHIQERTVCRMFDCTAETSRHVSPELIQAFPIEKNSGERLMSIEDVLNYAGAPTSIKDYVCNIDESHTVHKRLFKLVQPLLIIHLKRHKAAGPRQTLELTHPVKLSPNITVGQQTYVLVAVVAHAHSHYKTFAKRSNRSDEAWMEYNDEKVSQVAETYVMDGVGAYLLFYKLRPTDADDVQLDTQVPHV